MSSNSNNGKDTPESYPIIIIGPGPVFPLGRIVATPNVLRAVTERDDLAIGVVRHGMADWGEVTHGDWLANDAAMIEGGRILSIYRSRKGVTFWIITEADRSATTVLLPEDY